MNEMQRWCGCSVVFYVRIGQLSRPLWLLGFWNAKRVWFVLHFGSRMQSLLIIQKNMVFIVSKREYEMMGFMCCAVSVDGRHIENVIGINLINCTSANLFSELIRRLDSATHIIYPADVKIAIKISVQWLSVPLASVALERMFVAKFSILTFSVENNSWTDCKQEKWA